MSENNAEESSKEVDDTKLSPQEPKTAGKRGRPKLEAPAVEHPIEYNSWKPEKRHSWDQMYTNPNAFYFRNRPPGEKLIKGPWSEEAKMFFIEQLRKTDKIGRDWGEFARDIPGRVGYQCKAFFVKLVTSGELEKLAPDIKIPDNIKIGSGVYKTSKRLNPTRLEDSPQKIYLKVPPLPESKINSDAVRESILKNADLYY